MKGRNASCRALHLLVAAVLGACSPTGRGVGGERTSALLVTLDTTRADALACYGGPPGLTPSLDRLAREGLVYENAYTVAPLTQPAHASMLTGLYPPRHTVRDNGIWSLPATAETLAETARGEGFATAAFLSAVVLDAGFGLEQGFDVYDVPPRPLAQTNTEYAERAGAETVGRAAEWLATLDADEPFLLWVHLWEPHGPYAPPPAFAGRGATPYEDEVAAADAAIGSLLDALEQTGRLDDTLILVVADHGEAFGEHDEISHGSYCYQPTLRVPLLVRYPDVHRAGERPAEIVSVVDVHPTLVAALGLSVPAGVDGLSLHRRTLSEERGVYFESYYGHLAYGWSPLAGWIDADGKFISSAEPEFYAVDQDPSEAKDLIASTDVGDYRAAIEAVHARPALERTDEGVDAELRREIQALGYAAGAGADVALPHPLAPSDRVAPRRASEEQRLYQRANALLGAGRTDDARRDYDAILARNPHNLAALERRGICRARQGDRKGAIEDLERVVAAGRAHAETNFFLGVVLAREERAEEALAAFRRALAVDPNHVQALASIVELLTKTDRAAEAEPYAERLRAVRARG